MDLSDLFEGQELEIECPGCEGSFSVPADKVMKSGSSVHCPHCHEVISFEQDSSIDEANQSLKDFEKGLKRLGFK